LDAADPSNPRIDVIAVDTAQNIVVIKGTAGVNPVKPQVNPTYQVELTEIYVPAGATTPQNYTYKTIYNENVEWTSGSTLSSGTVNFNSTVFPSVGTKNLRVASGTIGNVYWDTTGAFLTSNYQSLSLRFSLASSPTNDMLPYIYLRDNGVQVTYSLALDGFGYSSVSGINEYNVITIPMSAFTFTSGSTFDGIGLYFGGMGAIVDVDYVQLQTGTNGGGVIGNYLEGVRRLAGSTDVEGLKNGVWQYLFTDSTGGSSLTFTNGLTESGGTVKLGGTISESRQILGTGGGSLYIDSLIYFIAGAKTWPDRTALLSYSNNAAIQYRNQNNIHNEIGLTTSLSYIRSGLATTDYSFFKTQRTDSSARIMSISKKVFIDSINTVSSTTGRKVLVHDTATGKIERIDPATLGGSQNLQQITDNGDTTTNAIQFGERRSVLGTILSDNYTSGGFGSNYDSSFASLTRTFNGSYLEVTGGNGTFNNYVRYSQWNGLNNWTQSVKFVPTDLSGTTYGIGLGTYSSNSFYAAGFVIQFILDNGASKGKMRIWSNGGASNVETGTSACTFNTTDTLIATVNYLDGVVTSTLYNKTQNVSASYTYTFSRSVAGSFQVPNTGKLSMYFFGGTQKIFNYTISSNETKNNVIAVGNSITYGYGASDATNRWVQKLFPGRYLYETSGGPGDRSAEGVQVLPQIKSLSPKYVILALGVNDAQSSVSGSTYSSNITTIVDTLLDNGITPILLSNSPLNSTSVVTYNDTLQAIATRWGLTYINTFDSLKNGTAWDANYTTDGIHPNNLGHLIISRIIERTVPQILGDTVIYTNRLKYNTGIRYFLGLNEQTGALELNSSSSSNNIDSTDNTTVKLAPSNTQTGASIDVTGDGGTVDNVAIFRSAATYANIVIDATKGSGLGQSALWFSANGTNKWQFGSDFAANGTKDFYVYDASSTRNPLYVTTGGDVRLGGSSGYGGTQAVTIKQTGDVGIGIINPSDRLHISGNLNISAAGNKIKIATGSNASIGTGILSSGTVTISTTAVTSSSLIFIQYTSCSNCGSTYIGTITNGTSFVVNSTNASDASTFNWWIIN